LDLATLIGLIGALALVALAIVLGGSFTMFLDVPSLLIVVLGSIMVVMMKFSIAQFFSSAKVISKAFSFKLPRVDQVIKEINEIAQIARKDGMLALDNRTSSIPLLKAGLRMLADGQTPDLVRSYLERERALTIERHRWGAKVLSAIGDVAPAMGMIGTLIGLVQMLSNMSDPKAIGPALAVALLTTLYGAVMANVIFLPMADKLNLRMTEEARLNAMIIDSISAIQAGTSPAIITQLLTSYIPPAKRPKQAK
jgi:chemotaxis protein MotA